MDWKKLRESAEVVAVLVIAIGAFYPAAAGLTWAIEIIGRLIREL